MHPCSRLDQSKYLPTSHQHSSLLFAERYWKFTTFASWSVALWYGCCRPRPSQHKGMIQTPGQFDDFMTTNDKFRSHYNTPLNYLRCNERERTSNSEDTTKPRVVSKATQESKIDTEHPCMSHHVVARWYRRMHRTQDGERYPQSAHGLKCPRLVHKIREVLVERLETENMVLFFLCGS
jgi:hypothetical protein